MFELALVKRLDGAYLVHGRQFVGCWTRLFPGKQACEAEARDKAYVASIIFGPAPVSVAPKSRWLVRCETPNQLSAGT